MYDGVTPVIELLPDGTVHAVNPFGANGLVSRQEYPQFEVGSNLQVSQQNITLTPTVTPGLTVYTFDERGNVSEETDRNGGVILRHVPDAYGRVQRFYNDGTPTGYVATPFGFGGQHGYYTGAATS